MKFWTGSFISKHRAKLESRQVLCSSVRNISCSSSPGLTLGVCGETCSLHSPKMLQYSNMPDYFFFKPLLNISPPYSLEKNQHQDLWAINFYNNSPEISSPILGPKGFLAHGYALSVIIYKDKNAKDGLQLSALPLWTGCYRMSQSALAVTGEGRFFHSEQGIASTAAEHRRPRELPKASSCGSKFWLDWSIIVDVHKA